MLTQLAGLLGAETFYWLTYAIAWGIYVRAFDASIEIIAVLYRAIGVPSGNMLAVLMPMILIATVNPQFDRGFQELTSPYFYLIPESPARKLIWVNMMRILRVCIIAITVFCIAGLIAGAPVGAVLAAMLAYIAAIFMVLGLRLATVRLMGVVSAARRRLVATLPVAFFMMLGVVGMLAIFYMGPQRYGLVIALLSFVGWCVVVGLLAFIACLKTLHNVDAPV